MIITFEQALDEITTNYYVIPLRVGNKLCLQLYN